VNVFFWINKADCNSIEWDKLFDLFGKQFVNLLNI
jgi:hypothetical protein